MKKRILFVEDEKLLRDMYVMMLDRDPEWEVETAGDGREALQLMDQCPFDVVVSDLKMPGMNGVQLLTEVRARYPLASRIILSGLDDQEEIVRCLGATHQFLAKPFEVNDLKATLARVGALDSYLADKNLQALVGQFGTLPSFPSLYVEIIKELDSDTSSPKSIAAIIAKDPAMTAKILQIVNSAALGLMRKVSSPLEAVQFLGAETVRSLVLSAHIFSCFDRRHLKGFSMARLWDHAIKTAVFARRILQLEKAEPAEAEDAYTAGMLHDVGKLMLADSLPDQFQLAVTVAREGKLPLYEAEMQVLGATHAGAAAYLLGLWGLPATIVEAVAFHHCPSRSDARTIGPLAAVHVADALEHETAGELSDPGRLLDKNYLAAAGVDGRMVLWRAEAVKLAQTDPAGSH